MDWRDSAVVMDGKSSLLHLSPPAPPLLLLSDDPGACLFQLLRNSPLPGGFSPAVAVAATVPTGLPSEATTRHLGPPAFHGFSWSALSQEKTCFLCRGDQMMELKKSIGDARVAFDGGIGVPHQLGRRF